MPSKESEHNNRVHPVLPEIGEECFVYRETWWVHCLFAAMLGLIGTGLVVLAFSPMVAGAILSGLACLVGVAIIVYAVVYLRHARKSANFICAHAGLFFPESKKFLCPGAAWLFVPWENILDYRVQLLFDETSSRGLVLTITVERDEQVRFFAGQCLFNLAGQEKSPTRRNIQVGYATFLPQPGQVLAKLRSYDGLMRPEIRGDAPAPSQQTNTGTTT